MKYELDEIAKKEKQRLEQKSIAWAVFIIAVIYIISVLLMIFA